MKAEFINPFLKAADNVIKAETGADTTRGQLKLADMAYTSQDCNILIGVTGQVEGQVLYGMSEATAKNIVSAILKERVAVFDNMVGSAIAELGNVITGHASAELSKNGYICNISPPTLITGRGVMITTINIKRILVPISSPFGDIEMSVALVESIVKPNAQAGGK